LDVWQYDAEGAIINRWHIHRPQVGNYVQCLQPLKGGAMAVGCYGAGTRIITLPGQSKDAWRKASQAAESNPTKAQEPPGARPPSVQELNGQLGAIFGAEPAPGYTGELLPLCDDWRTGGDWIGHYGRYWAILLAMGTTAQRGRNWVHRPNGDRVGMYATVGPGGVPGEGLRYWIYSLDSANRRSLQIPHSHLRTPPRFGKAGLKTHLGRETECDDHGEMYRMSQSGPGIVGRLRLPAGLYEIGVYDVNYDGHSGANRLRDYVVHIFGDGGRNLQSANANPRQSRIALFFDGVYKHWLARGPATIHFKLNRNHSFNTIVVGVFVDRLKAGWVVGPGAANLATAWSSPTAWRQLTRARNTPWGVAKALAAILPAMARFNLEWYAANYGQCYTELLRWDMKRFYGGNSNPIGIPGARSCARRLGLFSVTRCLRGLLPREHPSLQTGQTNRTARRTAGVRRAPAADLN
jgi:hypothetical protein